MALKFALQNSHYFGDFYISLNSFILNQDETKILLQCFTETIKTGKDRTTSKKAIAFLQNTYSKAIIEGNVNILFLNLIDLCISLVNKETEFYQENKENKQIPEVARVTTQNYPPGSGEAILWGAISGAVIGGELGGPLGALVGAAVGAAVSACSGAEVSG